MTVTRFLDFDGVLHPEPCTREELFSQLPLLQDVLLGHPTVQIVISSSWRQSHPVHKLKRIFQPEIRRRIVGVTPSLNDPSYNWPPSQGPQFARECMAWLHQNGAWDSSWVAIDDWRDSFHPACPDLLLTDSLYGLRVSDASTLN